MFTNAAHLADRSTSRRHAALLSGDTRGLAPASGNPRGARRAGQGRDALNGGAAKRTLDAAKRSRKIKPGATALAHLRERVACAAPCSGIPDQNATVDEIEEVAQSGV